MFDGTLGALAGIFCACLFYSFGRRDAALIYRDGIITSVLMRLKEMTPTSKARVPNGYGLDDTAHWIICLAEVQEQTGWRTGGEGLKKIAASLRSAPDHPHPTPEQTQEGERQKDKWEQDVLRVHKPKNIKTG